MNNIFLSIFTNDVEIDTRLSNLETKTQKQTATSDQTSFNKAMNMNNNKIIFVPTPLVSTDASNKGYVDNTLASYMGKQILVTMQARKLIVVD